MTAGSLRGRRMCSRSARAPRTSSRPSSMSRGSSGVTTPCSGMRGGAAQPPCAARSHWTAQWRSSGAGRPVWATGISRGSRPAVTVGSWSPRRKRPESLRRRSSSRSTGLWRVGSLSRPSTRSSQRATSPLGSRTRGRRTTASRSKACSCGRRRAAASCRSSCSSTEVRPPRGPTRSRTTNTHSYWSMPATRS